MKKIVSIFIFCLLAIALYGCEDGNKELSFIDLTIEYDGEYHTLEVKNLTSKMTVQYLTIKKDGKIVSETKFKDAGVYEYDVAVYEEGQADRNFEATLTIKPKNVYIMASDVTETGDFTSDITYEVNGLLLGDTLGENLYVGAENRVDCSWTNKNYNVTVIGGRVLAKGTIIESYMEYGSSNIEALPISLAPFAFNDTSVFENKTITSISFVYLGLREYYDEETGGYYYDDNICLPLYIVKKDFSTKREECTLENGKKILIDLNELISNPYEKELVRIDGLNIKVGNGETLVFGDVDMTFYMGYDPYEKSFRLVRNVFDGAIRSNHSFPLIVEGEYYM